MNLTRAAALLVLMSIFALSAQSGEYRAPQFKWKDKKVMPKVEVAKEKDFKNFEENKYRVEEIPTSQREVASEEEEEGRGPSSTPESGVTTPQHWPYK